jgi:hypothetical protein
MDDLKGKTIGVVAGEVNQRVDAALTTEYLAVARADIGDLSGAATVVVVTRIVVLIVAPPGSSTENALTASNAFPLSRTCSHTEAPVEANRVAIADINWTAAPSAEPAATVSVVGRVTYR